MSKLHELEVEHRLRVLYACESGSRAWGFASGDSDYDVRFIYLRPAAWYLSVQSRRDVLECPMDGELDLSGWDLPKALGLFLKSNPPLMEWLDSPVVYLEGGDLAARLRDLKAEFFSGIACFHHYLSMARGNYREYLRGDTVKPKKYFYVLRPVLACRWIERLGTMPPTEFSEFLVDDVPDPQVRSAIDHLLERKRSVAELSTGPRIDVLSDFLDQEIERLATQAKSMGPSPKPDVERLDRLFHDMLKEVWSLSLPA